VKICDFGWSTEVTYPLKGTFCGTIEYMPPEMIRNHPYDSTLDIWGLGILLYVIN
jgi:aurora kinase